MTELMINDALNAMKNKSNDFARANRGYRTHYIIKIILFLISLNKLILKILSKNIIHHKYYLLLSQ